MLKFGLLRVVGTAVWRREPACTLALEHQWLKER